MHPIVVIGASAGGLEPLRRIIAALPVPCGAAVFVVMHIGRHASVLPSLLTNGLPAAFAEDGAAVQPGHIYIAPPDQHMLLEPGFIRLTYTSKVHHTRPAADPLFLSAAQAYGDLVIGVVLSGGDGDGAVGLRAIKQCGGTTFIQRPGEALISGMPTAAIAAAYPDAVLPVADIAQRIRALCQTPDVTGPGAPVAVGRIASTTRS